MSRGGYELLEENMMQEKLKTRQEEATKSAFDTVVQPPSPPLHHHKWKQGRVKKLGEMTSPKAQEIAEKIDELEEQVSQGSFVPSGHQDILTTAIGRLEHPGHVRGAGYGVGIRDYFGPASCGSTASSINQDYLQRMTQKITQDVTQNLRHEITLEVRHNLRQKITLEVTQNLMKRFAPALQLDVNFQHSPVKVDTPPIAHVSTKGSCVFAIDPSEDFGTGIPDQCELYIDEHPPRLVAFGKVHEGGSTLHCVSLRDQCELYIDEHPPRR